MLAVLTSRKRGGGGRGFRTNSNQGAKSMVSFSTFPRLLFTAGTLRGGRVALSFPHLGAPKTNKKITALLSLNKIGTAYTVPACLWTKINLERCDL
jgi:hypothetical protein